ncbi:MAG: hypothetical protein ABEJ69_02050 [Candidatus Nanohaloarchaea archaeon]
MAPEEDQLYVKLEGYEHLLDNLDRIEMIMESIEESIEVLDEIRELKTDTLETIYENVDQLNQKLGEVGSGMPNLDEGEARQLSISEPEDVEIDDSVQELRSELDSLKDELSDV